MAVETKTEAVLVRLSPTQRERFKSAAEREGRRLSEWLRELGNRATEEEPHGAAQVAA